MHATACSPGTCASDPFESLLAGAGCPGIQHGSRSFHPGLGGTCQFLEQSEPAICVQLVRDRCQRGGDRRADRGSPDSPDRSAVRLRSKVCKSLFGAPFFFLRSINPMIDVGQVQGAYVMGLGYYLTEELVYDSSSGQLLSDGTWTYKPPSVLDIPIVFNTTLLPNAPNPTGILSSKTSGEPSLCMSANALFAVKAAINAALAELGPIGTTFTPLDGPATVAAIQQACLVDPSQFYF
eukprot:m.315369 g.315369  ORF g.315369 m.315369 type:complete len:237 (+) comp55435_c0_seq3:1990-2700(+)